MQADWLIAELDDCMSQQDKVSDRLTLQSQQRKPGLASGQLPDLAMADIFTVDIQFDSPYQMYLHKILGLSLNRRLDLWRAGILPGEHGIWEDAPRIDA